MDDLLQQAAAWLVQDGGVAAARVVYWHTGHATSAAYAGASASMASPIAFGLRAEGEACGVIELAPARAPTAEARKSLEDLGLVLGVALRRIDRAAQIGRAHV